MYYEEEYYPADLITFEPKYLKYSHISPPKTIMQVLINNFVFIVKLYKKLKGISLKFRSSNFSR